MELVIIAIFSAIVAFGSIADRSPDLRYPEAMRARMANRMHTAFPQASTEVVDCIIQQYEKHVPPATIENFTVSNDLLQLVLINVNEHCEKAE